MYSYTSVTWHENEFTPRWCKRTPFQRWWNTKMVLTQLHKFTLFWCHHNTLTFCVCFHAPLLYFFKITFYTTLTLLDIDECSKGSHDCDVNANCTNTNGSHSCTCKEGYTGKGESCRGKIRLWFSRPDLVFLLSYKFHHMHTFTFFDALEYNTRGYAVLPI